MKKRKKKKEKEKKKKKDTWKAIGFKSIPKKPESPTPERSDNKIVITPITPKPTWEVTRFFR